jgi:hypothetical protein
LLLPKQQAGFVVESIKSIRNTEKSKWLETHRGGCDRWIAEEGRSGGKIQLQLPLKLEIRLRHRVFRYKRV